MFLLRASSVALMVIVAVRVDVESGSGQNPLAGLEIVIADGLMLLTIRGVGPLLNEQ